MPTSQPLTSAACRAVMPSSLGSVSWEQISKRPTLKSGATPAPVPERDWAESPPI